MSKIAAGEVVERPASIVKELLENAIDAQASEVVIRLEKGGCESIRLTDNGCGICAEDLPLAFKSFATSKISQFDDLYKVHTFGFRGEALSSIAAVARVEMVTRTNNALCGSRIVVEQGRVEEFGEVGSPQGSAILVTNIFDSVPVRKRFLKSEAAEQQACLEVIKQLVLPQLGLKVKVQAGAREVLYVPAVGDMAERIALLFDPELASQLLPVQASHKDVSLSGYISRPSYTRSNTKQIFFYVNNRFIKDPLLQHALMTACGNLLEPRRYPVAILLLRLPPSEVDVNVHPAKREVRFRNPRDIYGLVAEAVNSAFTKVPISDGNQGFREATMAQGTYNARVEEALRRYYVSTVKKDDLCQPDPNLSLGRKEEETTDLFTDAPLQGLRFSELNYLGSLDHTYLIFAAPAGLIVMDQHAAHERVMLETLKKRYQSLPGAKGQHLLIPEVISLKPADYSSFLEIKGMLQDLGLEAETFGIDTIVVKTLPFPFQLNDAQTLIRDLLDSYLEGEPLAAPARKEKILIRMACRAAMMAKDRLSPAEVKSLCQSLDETPFGTTCPHGRPIYITIGHGELERMFKRR